MLKNFAESHCLKTKTDECGETIIAGKQGQIYECSDHEFGVMFMPPKTSSEPWGKWCPKKWGNFKRAALALGMTLRQNADSEGCLSFDPANREQSKLAIKIAGARPKRQISDLQKAAMVAKLQEFRFQPRQEGHLAA